MSIVLIVAIVCFCMGVVTAITKAPTLLSAGEWFIASIAVIVIFGRIAG